MRAIVVAHPDDEVLWFGSEIFTANLVLICFGKPANSNTHERLTMLMEMYPLCTVKFLPFSPGNLLNSSNWQCIDDNLIGLKLSKEHSIKIGNIYNNLVEALREELGNYDEIFTHNPWGEYGHEEHIIVSKAVMEVKSKGAIKLSPYYSNKSFMLAEHHVQKYNLSLERISNKVNISPILFLKNMYLESKLWTWDLNWHPHLYINFYRINQFTPLYGQIIYERFKIHLAQR